MRPKFKPKFDPKSTTERRRLGQALTVARCRADLTLTELSALTNISYSYLSKIERGEAVPSVIRFWAICAATKASADRIRKEVAGGVLT
jgi:transcriptional regulator with XRE-family HTH domain